MTTAIEIVDTAVKIGLGSVITGISGYFHLKAKNRHEITSSNLAKDKEILKETILKIEHTTELITLFLYSAASNENIKDIEKSKVKLAEAIVASGSASALSNMLGLTELSSRDHTLDLTMIEFYELVVVKGNEMSIAEADNSFNALLKKINSQGEELRPYITSAYRKLSNKK
ncbi:hypothetical protein [Agarivorans sp. DSG3-1]|uniref:hypothetical protein n=1 Tax=Agarivorans sp. DSG3-1 TaxID=3342249 RepID=UPI00398F1CA5